MQRWEKAMREDRYRHDFKNPSFSSSLLDEIYRSIDEGEEKHGDLGFYSETIMKKQSNGAGVKSDRGSGKKEEMSSALHRACLIEKWIDQKVMTQKISAHQRRQSVTEFGRKSRYDHELDRDAMFFSSGSSSSDSSSGGFSSLDSDSIYVGKSAASSYVPARPKPVRTCASVRSEKAEKTERKERTAFYEQREVLMFDDYRYHSATEQTPRLDESIIKSKSRALKIYSNLKKVKQPISPGGKLANFINSIFTAGTTKKQKNSTPSVGNYEEDRKLKSGQESTCSSASSFSRSCLSKHSPSTREKLRNGVKRNVRFYPVSVIVDEDCRPCGHKSLYKEESESSLMSVSLPTAWKIGSRKIEDEQKYHELEKSRRVQQVAKQFLKDYHHQNQKKNDVIMIDVRGNYNNRYEDEDEDEDAASCSSSDLFELDHLAVMSNNNRFCEELPVYETTHVDTNRAIANGLII